MVLPPSPGGGLPDISTIAFIWFHRARLNPATVKRLRWRRPLPGYARIVVCPNLHNQTPTSLWYNDDKGTLWGPLGRCMD